MRFRHFGVLVPVPVSAPVPTPAGAVVCWLCVFVFGFLVDLLEGVDRVGWRGLVVARDRVEWVVAFAFVLVVSPLGFVPIVAVSAANP